MKRLIPGRMAQSDIAAEVELVRSIVGKYFPIYDMKVSFESMTLYISPEPSSIGPNFEKLRKELKEKNYIPILNRSSGEYILSVIRRPKIRSRGSWLNRLFLVLTFITTGIAGMILWANYNNSANQFTVENFVFGMIFFVIRLMTILGVHEYCHYLASKKHGVDASLPFFIPSIPPFGTFGAFISIREPMPNRRALVEIGAAGPLGGLAVTIPIAILGLYLTAHGHPASVQVPEGGVMGVIMQPMYQLIALLVPLSGGMALHPLAFAAWVGFLVTAINLLPAGQLDGGHIARGLFGDGARYISYVTGVALFVLAVFYYEGWILFALLVFFLGLRHPAPLDDVSRTDVRTKVIGAAALLILFATFVPQPIIVVMPDHGFTMDVIGNNNTTLIAGGVATFQLIINDTGTGNDQLSITTVGTPGNWGSALYPTNQSFNGQSNALDLNVDYGSSAEVTLRIQTYGTTNTPKVITVQAMNQDQSVITRTVQVSVS